MMKNVTNTYEPRCLNVIEYKKKYKLKSNAGYLWILPAFVILVVFSYYPAISAFFYSLTDWNGMTFSFTYFDNFIRLFNDGVFFYSIKNMAILVVVCMVLGNVMTIFFCELLFNMKRKKLSAFFRFVFILPILVPGLVSMLLWAKIIFSPAPSGVMNTILAFFNIDKQSWYYGDSTVVLSIILTGFPWVAGTSFLIYLAGLQNIPESVYEAAKLDGIGVWKRVFKIDLPLIASQIKYFVVLGIIGGIQNFALQFAIIKPAPTSPSFVPGYYIYSTAIGYGEYGYACAMGFVLFVIILIITIINNKLMKSTEGI